jgi:hypothetical protein
MLLSSVIYKYIHFSRNIRRKNLKRWFYFSSYELINSSDAASLKAKSIQNRLSLFIIGWMVLAFAGWFLLIQYA